MVELGSSFVLDYKPIDNDHRRLIEIINHVLAAIDAGSPEECAILVPDFVEFAKTHFMREEKFLEKVGYPDVQKHRDHHSDLNSKMDEMLRLAKTAGDSQLACDSLRKELVYFLMDDVINADLDFKSYIADQDISEKS
ncbi:MAG: hemerythrin family protein [Rhodospirillales bacterium]|jgi:hemerythrin-like metal-binding protein|nr:hemerythrin family protein [Rhodospirillales bacterium]